MSSFFADEYQEATTFADWLRIKRFKFTHIANETYTTSQKQKARNMRMGVSRGVPDFMIIVNNAIVFVEMKRRKDSKTSSEQKEWIRCLNQVDHVDAKVCRGCDEAIRYVENIVDFQQQRPSNSVDRDVDSG